MAWFRTIRTVVLLCLLGAPAAWAKDKATRVVIHKQQRTLVVFQKEKTLATFHVALGFEPVGPKEKQGDGKTPEGTYVLDFKKPNSAYYKAIHVNYPNAQDRLRAKKLGVSPGGDIMIHGQPNGYGWAAAATQKTDWTLGCIALTNEDMDALWGWVEPGTPVEILP
jgi:murein L,D-transpeptidase YafK